MALQRGHLQATTPTITGVRSLGRQDLALLLEKRPTVTIKSLSDGHHRVARAVAAGLSNRDVAAICGRTENRVAVLKADPSFADLVAHYRGLVTADYVQSVDSYMEVATANMLKAETMLGDKLDEAMDTGETLPTRDLIAISRDAADRFGYGKMQKNLNVNVDFASQLEAARKRSAGARDITPSRDQTTAPRSTPTEPTSATPMLSLGPSLRRI